jgi:hypothetical protein
VEPFDVSVGLGAARADLSLDDAVGEPLAEFAASEFAAVVGEHSLEPPAGLLQLDRDTPGELRGLRDCWSRRRADDEVGPAVGAVAVDGGDLPDRAAAADQPTDEAAVDPDQFAWALNLDLRLGFGIARRFVACPVAGDQRQPLQARVQAMPPRREGWTCCVKSSRSEGKGVPQQASAFARFVASVVSAFDLAVESRE